MQIRQKQYFGFGSLQLLLTACSVLVLLIALMDVSSSVVLLGVIGIIYGSGYYYMVVERIVLGMTIAQKYYALYAQRYADEYPGVVVGIIVLLTFIAWWFL